MRTNDDAVSTRHITSARPRTRPTKRSTSSRPRKNGSISTCAPHDKAVSISASVPSCTGFSRANALACSSTRAIAASSLQSWRDTRVS